MASAGLEVARAHGALTSAPSVSGARPGCLQTWRGSDPDPAGHRRARPAAPWPIAPRRTERSPYGRRPSGAFVRLAQALPAARRAPRKRGSHVPPHRTSVRRVTAPDIRARKGGEPIVCLTAYTAPMAEILDPHCDLLLVGDSVGMVVHGLPNTVGVTLEMMILHGQAVMRGAEQRHGRRRHAVRHLRGRRRDRLRQRRARAEGDRRAGREGRGRPADRRHHRLPGRARHPGDGPCRPAAPGGERGRRLPAKGRTDDERAARAGRGRAPPTRPAPSPSSSRAWPKAWPARSPPPSTAPTIGIGASAGCDGQILVTDDMLGLFDWTPEIRPPLRRPEGRDRQGGGRLRRRCPRPPFSCRSRDLCPGRRNTARRPRVARGDKRG